MDNPYKIRPGEKLTLDEVFNRFLDWCQWCQENKRSHASSSCDTKLHHSHLCCEDHMAMTAENHAFFVYFFHHTYDETIRKEGGFSMNSMRDFIRKHKVSVTSHKAGSYFGLSSTEWANFYKK